MNLPIVMASAIVVASAAAAQTSLPLMRLELQSLDGNAHDIEGPSSVAPPAIPEIERVWFAHGRRRAQIRVSDRERMHLEEDLGYDYESTLADVATDYDPVDSQKDRMFVLTSRQPYKTDAGVEAVIPARIRVDRISNPTAPELLQTFVFADDERPISIATSPDQNQLLVIVHIGADPLTASSELRIYDYSNGFVLDTVNPPAVAFMPTGTTTCSAKLRQLMKAQVARIQDGAGERTVALVTATVIDDGCNPNKPQPTALLVCDIETPSAPAFFTQLATQAWQPCRTPPTAPCADFRINDLVHVRTNEPSPRDLVYVAGGKQVQLWELDLTHLATSGITASGPYVLNSADPLTAVRVDPEAPASSDYLYLLGQNRVHVVDRQALSSTGTLSFASSVAHFGNGPAGDPLFMIGYDGTTALREIWSLAMQNASYPFRITDFTQDPLSAGLEAPDVSQGFYSAGPTDGAVASFDWDSAYLPTFGGLVRWDVSGDVPIPNPNPPSPTDPDAGSYKPATFAGEDYTTEHIALEDMGSGTPSSDWHALSPTAEGSFFAWPIHPTTHDPRAGFAKAPPAGYWPAWSTGTKYGNDLVVATRPIVGTKWVLFDYSLNPNLSSDPLLQHAGQFGIGRYNWTLNSWASPLLWSDSFGPDAIMPLARALAVQDRWLFVAGTGGFLVFDLTAPPAVALKDTVYVNRGDILSNDGGAPVAIEFARVLGIETYDRDPNDDEFLVFASLGDNVNGFALAMYVFDASSGHVVTPDTLQQTDGPALSLFDGTGGNDFPGVYVEEGGRISMVEMSNDPEEIRLYCATANGGVLEVGYALGEMTPLSYWHNGGFYEEIQDCNAYKVTLPGGVESIRVVVAKTQETFEVVIPPDMP